MKICRRKTVWRTILSAALFCFVLFPPEVDAQHSDNDTMRQGTDNATAAGAGGNNETGLMFRGADNASDAAGAPRVSVSRLYKYYDPGGTLHLTDGSANVPPGNVHEILIYPVTCREADLSELLFRLNVDGQDRWLRLVDVRPASKALSHWAVTEFLGWLTSVPLRLTYDPRATRADGTLHGRLSLRTGESVGFEMARLGLADNAVGATRKDGERSGRSAGDQ